MPPAMTTQDIRRAIAQLAPDELAELSEWLDEHKARLWGRQAEADLDARNVAALLASLERDPAPAPARAR